MRPKLDYDTVRARAVAQSEKRIAAQVHNPPPKEETTEMQLKKKTKEGKCDAMRCKTEYVAEQLSVFADGVKLCPEHALTYKPAEATLAIDIDDQGLANIETIKTEAEEQLAVLADFTIESQEKLDIAGEFLRDVKGTINTLEAARKTATKPLHDAKTAIDTRVKPVRDALQAVEKCVKGLIADYGNRLETAKAEAAADGRHDDAIVLPAATLPAGVSVRTVYKVRIVDVDLIPREYMVPDSAKLQAAANLYREKTEIPGIEVYTDAQVSARGAVTA